MVGTEYYATISERAGAANSSARSKSGPDATGGAATVAARTVAALVVPTGPCCQRHVE